MSISFAGVDLCLADPDGELAAFLERSLPLDDMRLWGEDVIADRIGNWQAQYPETPQFGLPRYNWPAPPRMKLNTLWWPVTGATRWARGLFLASADQLAQIQKAIPDERQPACLILSDGTNDLTVLMYMLPPRPISAGTDTAYLLPLVDSRYFWQFANTGDLAGVTTWAGLLTAINAALPGALSVKWTPNNEWPDPDVELLRSFENVATILDAMAASVGGRVVCQSYSITIQTAAQARQIDYSSIKELKPLAGNYTEQTANELPETIRVVFPKCIGGSRLSSYGTYPLEMASDTSAKNLQPSKTALNIVETFSATFTSADDANPTNKTELESLRDLIVTGITGWWGNAYDYSWIGLASMWPVDGYDDYLWFHCGHQLADGSYAYYTRVCNLPSNVIFPMQFHKGLHRSSPGFYQLLTDIQGNTYRALANPCVMNDPANQVEVMPVVDHDGTGTFTLTIEGHTTAAITYSVATATLVANIQAAINTLLGTNSIVASDNLTFTFSGGSYASRPITGHVTATLDGTLAATETTIGGSGSASTTTTDGKRATYVRYDPHNTLGVATIDPAWTVVVVDTAAAVGAWRGDMVQAVATGGTMQITYKPTPTAEPVLGTFPVYELTERQSAQLEYTATFYENLVYAGYGVANVWMQVAINGYARETCSLLTAGATEDDPWIVDEAEHFIAWDALLGPDQYVPGDAYKGPVVLVEYFADARKWLLTGAPCNTGEPS